MSVCSLNKCSGLCKYVEGQRSCLNLLNYFYWLISYVEFSSNSTKSQCWSWGFSLNASLPFNTILFAFPLWPGFLSLFLPDWHFAFSPSLLVISQTVSFFVSVCPSGPLLWWHSSHVSLIKASCVSSMHSYLATHQSIDIMATNLFAALA